MTPQIPIAAKRGDLNSVLPVIAKDFEAIKVGFTKLVQLKKQEGAVRSSEGVRQRQLTYKEKFSKVKIERIDPRKKTLEEHTKGFFSTLKSISGVLGGIFLVLGAAGIAKMIFSSDAGKFLGKFLSAIFTGLIDLVKSAINIVQTLFQDIEIKSSFFKTISAIFKLIGESLLTAFGIFKSFLSDSDVISSVLNTIKSVFSAIFNSIESIAFIVADIFIQNTEKIKNGLIDLISKIIDVIIPILSITSQVFKDLMSNEKFMGSLKDIAKGVVDLIVSVFKINYVDTKTGEQKSVAGEIVKIIGEAGIAYLAFLGLKARLIEAGAAISAANFSKAGPCDCGAVEPPDDKEKTRKTPRSVPGGRVPRGGRGGPVSPERLAQIERARGTEASRMEKLKYLLEKKWKQIGLLAEKFRYSKIGQSKIIDLTIRLLYRLGVKISETRLFIILSTLVAGAVASGTGFASIIGVAILAANLYFAYDIVTLLLENIDELNKEIEDEEKKSESPPPKVDTSPVATQADVRRIDNAIEENKKSTTPSPPKPTESPTSSPSSAAEVLAKQREMAGTESVAPERTMSSYSYEATAALKNKMKKGDVIADQHEAGTDVLAQNISSLIPSFGLFTAFDDAYHSKVHPNSKHNSGLAIDFTIRGGKAEYARAAAALKKHLLDAGLNMSEFYVKDEANNRDEHTTGDHIHVQFQSKEAAAKYRNRYSNIPLTAFAKDTSPAGGTPFTLPTPGNSAVQQAEKEKEEKQTFASLMFGDLTKGMAALDQMTGGKLGLMSDEMRTAMRTLEDEANKGGSFLDLSTTVISNKTENRNMSYSTVQQTNESILSTILNRQYG